MEDFSALYKSCTQCPRNCSCNRASGKTGFCKETAQVRIASAGLHFGEEPLITVHGGSGTIFFTGCTLHCAFCQNYQIAHQGMGREVNKDEFIKICLALQNAGAENINLVTGSHIIPQLAEYLKAARNAGVTVPYCWNSSAYEKVEMLELLKGLVTVWLPDLKTLSAPLAKSLFGAENYPESAQKAIKWMIKNNPLKIVEKTSGGLAAKGSERDASSVSSADSPATSLASAATLSSVGSAGTLAPNASIKEKMESGVIIRHLFLPGRFAETADTLEWLKANADGKACISLMSQYTPVPYKGSEQEIKKRSESLKAIEDRLVSKEEYQDLQDLIEAYDFEYLFYQELSDDTDWLPDFNRIQPFSNKLAKPIWHWTSGLL